MQKQLTAYLFQCKTCPLPGVGTLSVVTTAVESDFTNKTFIAPKPVIQFEQKETDTKELLDYLSQSTGADHYEATEVLSHFCDDLKQKMTDQSGIHLNDIGTFFVDSSRAIKFKEEAIPSVFTQPVLAERVIHPDAEHQILVGDKETTNTVMTELLSPREATKDRWWIWAIVLGIIGLLALGIYFTQYNGAAPFGNVINYIHS